MNANFTQTEKGIQTLRNDRRRMNDVFFSIESKAKEWMLDIDELTDEAIAEACQEQNVTPEEVAAIVWAITECVSVKDSMSYVEHQILTA